MHRWRGASEAVIGRDSVVRHELAHPTGFEPVTSAFGGQHSIQLSYGCILAGRTASRTKRDRFITQGGRCGNA